MSSSSSSSSFSSDDLLEINSSQLVPWLLNRGKLNRDWANQLDAVEREFDAAFAVLPDAYQHPAAGPRISLVARAVLSDLEVDPLLNHRSWLGQYSHEATRQFHSIVRKFDRHSLFLADLARFLTRSVELTIPACKRSLLASQQQLIEINKRIQESETAVKANRERAEAAFRSFGLSPEGGSEAVLSARLQSASHRTERFVSSIVQLTRKQEIESSITFYQEYQRLMKQLAGAAPDNQFDAINRVRLWGSKIDSEAAAEEFVLLTGGEGEVERQFAIDWGSVKAEDAREAISNDQLSVQSAGAQEDQWAFEIESSGEAATDSIDSHTESRSSTASFPLLTASFRHSFHSEVSELSSFLRQRLIECETPDPAFAALFESNSMLIQLQSDPKRLSALANSAAELLAAIEDPQFSEYLHLQSSANYRDRLAHKLRFQLELVERSQKNLRIAMERKAEIQQTMEQERSALSEAVKWTKLVRSTVETEIEKLFPGKRITLFGSINSIEA